MGKQSSTLSVEVNVVGCVNFKRLVRREFLEFNYVLYFACIHLCDASWCHVIHNP